MYSFLTKISFFLHRVYSLFIFYNLIFKESYKNKIKNKSKKINKLNWSFKGWNVWRKK